MEKKFQLLLFYLGKRKKKKLKKFFFFSERYPEENCGWHFEVTKSDLRKNPKLQNYKQLLQLRILQIYNLYHFINTYLNLKSFS